jgi:hypothetical protein
MQARQPVLIALASLAPCLHATLLIANACRGTRAGLAAVQTGCGLKLATAQRAQRHRLFSQPRQQTSPHCWPRRSLGTQKTRLQPAAASPADPYLKTAKLRQLLIVLDITDIRDLQSLIRQASACGAGCKSLIVSKSPLAPTHLCSMRTPNLYLPVDEMCAMHAQACARAAGGAAGGVAESSGAAACAAAGHGPAHCHSAAPAATDAGAGAASQPAA